MRMVEVIERKRDGEELSREEIGFFIDGYVRGEIPDYQASALLMAVMLRGMTDSETRDLTLAMARSGETLDLSDVADIVVDKHSTGGVGDKVSLVAVPAVAAAGLPVGKMSGRGLGFSGGPSTSWSPFRDTVLTSVWRSSRRNCATSASC